MHQRIGHSVIVTIIEQYGIQPCSQAGQQRGFFVAVYKVKQLLSEA